MISLIMNNLYIPQITSKQNTLLNKHSAPVLTVDEIILHPPHLGNLLFSLFSDKPFQPQFVYENKFVQKSVWRMTCQKKFINYKIFEIS